MAKLSALIAAAGRGTRAGLSYPKTLFPIQGTPILVRIAKLLHQYDTSPTVIVSPAGKVPIQQCLESANQHGHLVVQPEPRGMGEAVQRFADSPAFDKTEHVLLVWGDVPFIQPETLEGVVSGHLRHNNDFTFATRQVDAAYTVVARDSDGQVLGVIETREQGIKEPQPGERDIGLFCFRKDLVLEALREDLSGKWGQTTGEHGFLYIIGHLAVRGWRVEALPIATKLDLVSLNSMKDLDLFL